MKKILNKNIIVTIKGLIVGGTMCVPGVSGGSMAMILGIYNKLISSVSSFFKDKKKNFIFLLLFCIGGIVGVFLFSKPILYLLEKFPFPTLYFFLGAVAGGIPMIFKEAHVVKFSYKIPIDILIGLVLMLCLELIPQGFLVPDMDSYFIAFLLLLLAGFISAVALVLPGISVSYMLLVLGLYKTTMSAVSQLNIAYLIPLALGLLIGIVATTKFLEYLMEKYTMTSYLIILGFIVGSMAQVFPGIPKFPEILICIISVCVGFFSLFLLSLKTGSEN